jgi:D-arabinose 1-dehydrogenase-like Zn-dependent alcohol dehydrogenase
MFASAHCRSGTDDGRTGLCASDKSLLRDEWAAFGAGMREEAKGIAGHEGAGTVVAVGDGAGSRWKVGDRAGIKWVASTCGECEFVSPELLRTRGGDPFLTSPSVPM